VSACASLCYRAQMGHPWEPGPAALQGDYRSTPPPNSGHAIGQLAHRVVHPALLDGPEKGMLAAGDWQSGRRRKKSGEEGARRGQKTGEGRSLRRGQAWQRCVEGGGHSRLQCRVHTHPPVCYLLRAGGRGHRFCPAVDAAARTLKHHGLGFGWA
jgi:hypothetical protein